MNHIVIEVLMNSGYFKYDITNVNKTFYEYSVPYSLRLAIKCKKNFYGIKVDSWVPPEISQDVGMIINHSALDICTFETACQNILGGSYLINDFYEYTDVKILRKYYSTSANRVIEYIGKTYTGKLLDHYNLPL